MTKELKERFDRETRSAPVVIYMKGTPDMPMCGFSRNAALAFRELGVPVAHVNVLMDEEAWSGIKEYTDWPTIPQVFIGGEFIGGSSIVLEYLESGELQRLVDEAMAKYGAAASA